jgi:hypothetical protein
MEALPRFDRILRLAGGEALLQRRIGEVAANEYQR